MAMKTTPGSRHDIPWFGLVSDMMTGKNNETIRSRMSDRFC